MSTTELIRDLPREMYDLNARMSCSTIFAGLQSMRHLQWELECGESPQTPALAESNAAHVMTLEPDKVADIGVWGKCSGVKKGGNPCGYLASRLDEDAGLQYCTVHAPDGSIKRPDFINPAQMVDVKTWSTAVRLSDAHSAWLDQPGAAELTVYGELHGVRWKSRLDWVPDDREMPIVDLKFVRAGDGAPRRFASNIVNHNYGLRAACYQTLLAAAEGFKRPYVWVVVEKSPPYEVSVYQASETLLACARAQLHRLVDDYKISLDTGNWPGYTPDVRELDGPDWWVREWLQHADD